MLNATSGHHPDGSGVQRHSCGSHYPFVVGIQDGRPEGKWFVMAPSGQVITRCHSGIFAFEFADRCAQSRPIN